ncbi:hypothetical protein CISIN_1g003576mg [Citrus sinensis]|uniref:RING-type E3 ubiquitin transferase n=1 Tax=Citrus sinensis TaxID=2711 RepID=A0A067DQM4_CITSI|nr:hypothetical protein CISIN_1g003576mg [Citrus sinensis]
MEVKDIVELPNSPALSVAVAVKGNRKSRYAVLWALEKFIPEGINLFKLLHVRPRITSVPTPTSLAIGHPVGNFIPIEQVRDDVAAAYKQEEKWKTDRLLLPFRNMCAQRRVEVEVKVIESDDVAKAIADEVASCNINKLVIGAQSQGIFTWKFKKNNLSSRISICVPSFCTVYGVEKGKLSSVRPSDLGSIGSTKDDSSDTGCSNSSSSSHNSSSQTDLGSAVASYTHSSSPSLPTQRLQALSAVNKTLLHLKPSSTEINHSRCQSFDVEEQKDASSSCLSGPEVRQTVSRSSSYRSMETENQDWSDQASTTDVLPYDSSSESQVDVNFELEKLRIELRHVRGMYAIAQNEANDASRKVSLGILLKKVYCIIPFLINSASQMLIVHFSLSWIVIDNNKVDLFLFQ